MTPGVKKLQINLPVELHRSFKIECTKLDVDMTEIFVLLMQRWLAEQELTKINTRLKAIGHSY